MEHYVIGVDFGTDSVRALLVNALTGDELSSAVAYYPRWQKGLYCNASLNQFRQHPLDYIESFETAVNAALNSTGNAARQHVRAISFATTGSTPVAVDKSGTPLSLSDSFKDDPDAMFILWKDHTSIREAHEINEAAAKSSSDYLKYVGGTYSSEWFWAKLLRTLRVNESVRNACYSWVEHSDWMPFLLCGGTDTSELKRNVCAAGHKALWSNEFGGLPSADFFKSIDPMLTPFAERFGKEVYPANLAAGNLSEEWAERLGLHPTVVVGIGAIDAHVGAVGGKIKPYYLSKVIGTSTCDMMVVPKDDMKGVFVKGISGQVEDSIVPGMVGLEAGQSAFGDIYSWYRDMLLWPLKNIATDDENNLPEIAEKIRRSVLKKLDEEAAELPVDEAAEFALDWFNGRRSPHADPTVKGLIGGLTLGSTPPRVYRALVEATCFGSRAIVESIEQQGIKIEGISAIGGIATKSQFVIQMMADVLNRPVEVYPVEQTVALGAAMFASVAAGVHEDLQKAEEAIGKSGGRVVNPRTDWTGYYDGRYELYKGYGAMQD